MQPSAKLSFSVIATVRNEHETIAAFVDSLLQQSHKPDEIIIVDGASTDGTKEILDDYAVRHDIRVISQPCNIAQGRNLGIAAAQGSHIAVTDAGCRVDQDWLQEMLNCFLDNPGVDVAAGNFLFETHTPFEEAVVKATFQPDRGQTDQARYYPSSRSVAFTKAAWERAGGYPEWLYAAEDTLFSIRLRQIGCGFVFCRRAIVRWRPRETWRALARQRYNYSRGNARVGIGTAGYLTNLRIHGLILALLLLTPLHGIFLAGAVAVFARHVYRHLWPQAVLTAPDWGMRFRVLAVMEFVRLVNMYAFLRGRWDRRSDPEYIAKQIRYMGVASVDELDFSAANSQPNSQRTNDAA
jgi:glycosyltransferase involved in cell wall biosynthesis